MQAGSKGAGGLAVGAGSGATSTTRSCITTRTWSTTPSGPSTTHPLGERRHAEALVCRLARGPHRLSHRRCRDAPAGQTGYMHNRLRMVVASFLTKDLGLSWQRGEAWFARHLNDFDPWPTTADGNGRQTGCDAQPYFRIFNPVAQSERFDRQGASSAAYLPSWPCLNPQIHAPGWPRWIWPPPASRWCKSYPLPVVDHAQARLRTLERCTRWSRPGRCWVGRGWRSERVGRVDQNSSTSPLLARFDASPSASRIGMVAHLVAAHGPVLAQYTALSARAKAIDGVSPGLHRSAATEKW